MLCRRQGQRSRHEEQSTFTDPRPIQTSTLRNRGSLNSKRQIQSSVQLASRLQGAVMDHGSDSET